MSTSSRNSYPIKVEWEIRFIDFIFSSILIIVLSPLALLVAFLVTIDLGFPPLFFSVRVGRFNRNYYHLKFKTMKPGKTLGRVFFETNRITQLGKFLRNFHLDELPELFLIFTGKMSFVGPRPLPHHLQPNSNYLCRTLVKPGWTGLAQIKLIKTGKLSKKLQMELDCHYVKHRTLNYYLWIIGVTFLKALNPAPLDIDPQGSYDRIRFQSQYLRKNT